MLILIRLFLVQDLEHQQQQKKLNNLVESEIRLKKLQNKLENLQHRNNQKYLKQHCEVLIENKLDNQEEFFGRTKYMISSNI